MFERQYAEEECLWGLSPDPLLVENIEEIPVGKALDLGVGEGRNALFLAHKGFQVTGIDISSKAIEKFLELAKEKGLIPEGLVMDIRDFEFRPDAYNLIVATATLHFLRRKEVYEITSKIIRSITPGGYVYIKDFTVDDPSYQTAKKRLKQIEKNTFYSPKLFSYLYFFSHNELKGMFKDFEIKVYKEEISTDSGHGKSGPHKHGIALLFAKKS
ncbi:MAG: methyltransferase domain-containing protein [Candidatus Nanoarchaeia archaeon]